MTSAYPSRRSTRGRAPAAIGPERHMRASGLDPRLCELVKIRASQINGCAYFLDMHDRAARAGGEDQRRLDVRSAWREASILFTGWEPGNCEYRTWTQGVTFVTGADCREPPFTETAHCLCVERLVGLRAPRRAQLGNGRQVTLPMRRAA